MEWIDRLNEVISYIEEHLNDEINYEVIGEIAVCPVGSFQRAFSLMTGITLSEYIRRRKLTMAAFELQSTDCKVIDVAVKYGYESSDAFCVAFKKIHGITPTTAKQQNIKLKSYPRLTFTLTIKGDVEMNYRVVERDSFKTAGKIVTSSLENNIIPQFWDKCKKDGTIDKLLEIGVNAYTLGMCFGYNDEGKNDYMVGIETNHECIESMKTVVVPKSTWLVFESIGPINPTLGNTWGRIYGEFLPQSIYKQATLPTMEKYFSGDVDSDDYYIEIWIPVVKE
ncbi:AraC family transcriptional regulator [Brassicibacter mesophilus]|uniref:AraC family transcriptional regulator n=1 Tax=Brassicibacter mesophilus TaxID=745119 RepID=UPI003D225204